MDLASRSTDSIENELVTLAVSINAASARMLACIAELDRREEWRACGFLSCAHWLSWRVGIDMNAAREKVRVARALAVLPHVRRAFERGEVSYSKVRALTRVATAENEEALLAVALHGNALHLEKLVRAYRRMGRLEQLTSAAHQQAERSLATHWDEDGMLVVHGRLSVEQGAALLKALEVAEGELFRAGARNEDASEVSVETPSASQKRADALARVAERALCGTQEAALAQVVVHVDAEVLADAEAPGRAHVEDGPDLAVDTVRRLACDATVVTMALRQDGSVLDVGRRRRTIPPALRRALIERDGCCRFPGCTHRITHAHHLKHWAVGGETSLANTLLICPRHHRLVHEGGVRVELDAEGLARFFDAQGRRMEDVTTGAPLRNDDALAALETLRRERHQEIIASDELPVWSGERLSWDYLTSALA